ncbi:nuclear transport factor 2 family protein [Planomonospora parontospora]|uniref:nuclear transport factor 2 family protein n=1 Tax=Planomonospora parontospora TaxID=58119 RepID=UPI0019421E47|nr:nuclear transport factor 2 family protein [Planomonospora parontospora]GGL15664.1 ketosteroid isomerase [Planomonospora parontospora subsp. antibiotica]GII15991.1 ketosteroid isomerase [Planomonospora parontospora subsp. antibiotica]
MNDSAAVVWDASYGDHPARRAAHSSMAAVAAGRREEWLGLFAPDALVEDPVGPSMLDPAGKGHRGRDGIGRFWDGHVGSVRGFRFRVADSFANGPCCANVVSITMTLDGGAVMTVDCVIVYTVDESGLITSLRAHWEPERALATLTGP